MVRLMAMKSDYKMSMQVLRQEFKFTGGEGSRSGQANKAGICQSGMCNTFTTTHNQGDQIINNQGDTGNIATGDNHSGPMSASGGGNGPPNGNEDYKMSKQEPNEGITVTGVDGNNMGESIVAGIVHGGMGNRNRNPHNQENRQQPHSIGNAHDVVGGQDMRGAAVDQGGDTEGRSGHKELFRGKVRSDVRSFCGRRA